MVSLDIGGVVSEIVAPPGKECNDVSCETKESRYHKQQQHQRSNLGNVLEFIQASQLALYWRRIKMQIHRRRQGSNLNSTEPDTSTDREIGHAVLVDEIGQGTPFNVCRSCNCTTIQNCDNNINNNNLGDNRSTTIINLSDVTELSAKHRDDDDEDNDDDVSIVATHLNNPTITKPLNIAESTANIAVSTVIPATTAPAPAPTTTATILAPQPTTLSPLSNPSSVQHLPSKVTATSLTTTKTTLTTTSTSGTEGIESKRERKAAKTLAIITGVFVMCWLPFFVMAITMPLLNLKPHKYVFALMLWLGYVNSMLNPIIYTIFSPDFRKAFKRLLCAMDDSNEIRRRKRMMRGGAGGCFTSTSQLQTTYGRSTTFVSGIGSNYNGNSLSSNNSQTNNNNNKGCNIILDKNSEANSTRFFFDYRKCLPEVCRKHLDNLCNLALCCSYLSNLMSSSSSNSFNNHEEQCNNNNANINTREQSLRRTAMKNSADRQNIGDESNLARQGHLLNLRNNLKDNNEINEINEVSNNNNNNDKSSYNQVINEPIDRCSPLRRLYLREQREQDQQQQGTITSNLAISFHQVRHII